jgi:hypothetical protein
MNSCGTATATKTITILRLPDAGTIAGPTSICIGQIVTLSESATGGAWYCSNSNASITGGGIVTGLALGQDTIGYTFANSCGNAFTTVVMNISALPSAGNISGPDSVCIGELVVFSESVPGGSWNSKNSFAIISSFGLVTGATAGTDTILYSVSNLCGTVSASKAIRVLPQAYCASGVNQIGSMASPAMKLIPNPNNGSFTIILSSEIDEQADFIITDLIGKKIKRITGVTNKAIIVQLDGAPGIYFISAHTAAAKYTAKVIVE